MKVKPVIPRALANQDVEDAIRYDLDEQAEQAAPGFIDAVQGAFSHIGRHPASAPSDIP
ncbi:hypothetical protein [Pseudomonas vanderleydeniana]|uniref:hypothetical protein n=1 Tax=Pseudomonas vanderleydeniana TaxID=2745495 RepID=UPI003461D81F